MAASITTNSTNSAGTGTATSASRFGQLSSDQFTRIMMSELKAQDPLKPSDSNTLLQQLSSIRSIESNLTLTTKLDSILKQNQLASAGNLLGTQVGGLDEQNNRVTGLVVGITTGADGIKLTLDRGWQLPFKNVDSIVLPVITPPTTTPPTTVPPTTTPPVVTPTPPFVPPGAVTPVVPVVRTLPPVKIPRPTGGQEREVTLIEPASGG